ncbi:hypothetical protein NZK33_13945 [Cyanobium sp. FGCU-6]|nr:hypothetical protein [Cyanobium sp. FGCU6]
MESCVIYKMLTPGKTLNRLLSVSALALAASAAVNAGNAQAILVYEFLEEGANVRLNVSGSLTGLPSSVGSSNILNSNLLTGGFTFFINTFEAGTPNFFNEYPVAGPANIGTNTTFLPISNYTGTGVFVNKFYVGLLPGYIEGDPITGSGLILGQSFSSLGLNSTTPGALLGSWTVGTDSIEVRIGGGGGAAVPGPLPLFGAAAAFAHSRRLRARLRASSSPQA